MQTECLLPPAPTRSGAIRRTGRTSLVVLSLATVMVIGGVAVGVLGAISITASIRDGDMGLNDVCDA